MEQAEELEERLEVTGINARKDGLDGFVTNEFPTSIIMVFNSMLD